VKTLGPSSAPVNRKPKAGTHRPKRELTPPLVAASNDDMTIAPQRFALRAAVLVLALAVLVTGCLPGAHGKKLGPLPEMAFVVPDLTGMTLEQAGQVLAKNGLRLGQAVYVTDSTWDELTEPDRIVAQSETPGARLPGHAVIDVFVYRPTIAEYGEVPSVVGLKYADAVKLLKDAGFLPGEVSKRHIIDTRRYDEVYRQSPEAGATARRWSKINLGLYGPAEEGFVHVPRLTGLDAAQVPTVLGKLGLVEGRITFEHAPTASLVGTVRAQSPAIGAKVRTGTKVDVVVYSE
jgi:beta-lactam-binding protein with PASTA domain